jgi:hypothetical protein
MSVGRRPASHRAATDRRAVAGWPERQPVPDASRRHWWLLVPVVLPLLADEGDATVLHMTALIDGERVADDPKGGSRRKVLSRH